MKDDLPWMLDDAVRTGLRDFRRRELHIRAVRLRRRLLGAATRFWRFRDGRLTGSRAQRRADHAARLLRRAARPGRILKLMADKRGKRIHTITSAPRMPGGRGNHAQKNPPGWLRGERCCAVLRLGGYHHGKPDLDLFAVGVRKAGGDQADLAFIGQIDI